MWKPSIKPKPVPRRVRPLSRSRFGTIADPFTILDLGGWPAAKKDIVDAIWRDRVLAELGR